MSTDYKPSNYALAEALRRLAEKLDAADTCYFKAPTLTFHCWYERDVKEQFTNLINIFGLTYHERSMFTEDLEAVGSIVQENKDEHILTIRAVALRKEVCEVKKVMKEVNEYTLPTCLNSTETKE